MNDRLGKLPRWARDEIENSRRRIAELEQAVRAGTTSAEYPRTNLFVTRDYMEWAPSAFHCGRIMLGPQLDDFVDFRFENYAGQPRVYVHSGFSNLVVRPRSGNAIHITTER